LHKAIAEEPDFVLGYSNLGNSEFSVGHAEAAIEPTKTALRLLNRSSIPDLSRQDALWIRRRDSQAIAFFLGDYTNAVSLGKSGAEGPDLIPPDSVVSRKVAQSLALQHDGSGALAYLHDMPLPPDPTNNALRAITRFQVDAALENWQAVVVSEASAEQIVAAFDPGGDRNVFFGTILRPRLALAKAKLGDTAGAEAIIATTPGDCYDCIRLRGDIAAIEGNWGRADYWFARAVHDAPSIPFAETDWGQSFLMRGDPDGAIAKYTLANQKGPHFADPLEGWGEALMAKNRSDLALAKFEEAEKYAPNWGRLHMKWGEALGYAGEKDEAQKQFALAAGLDLSSADKAELAKVRG
jgi:tetratricopeptide (TPR) repeat protein